MEILGITICSCYVHSAAAVGALLLLYVAWTVSGSLWRHFVRSGVPPSKFGSWAVVTGATDGIGRALASELARAGVNVALISRTKSKLDEAAAEIAQKFNVQTRVLAVDFAKADNTKFDNIADFVKDIDVGVLVNNVGVSYDHAQFFLELDEERMRQLIEINVNATTRVTRAVLPGMEQRKRGCVVNISSGAGSMQCSDPLYAVYAGTKSYIDYFSRALHFEYASRGISVQCFIPFLVTTKLSKIRRSSLTIPSATAFARSCMRHLGHEAVVHPHWSHALLGWVVSVLPFSTIGGMRLKSSVAIRKRALKKAGKKAD